MPSDREKPSLLQSALRRDAPLVPAPSWEPLPNLKPVYIVGMPRSGTTWLAWLLAQHPSVTTLHQSGLFYCFEHLKKWWERDIRFSRWPIDGETARGDALYDVKSTADELAPEALNAYCRHLGAHIYGELAARTEGLKVVVEQTPEHLALAPFIEAVFPEASFLHLVRDPRAVYASLREAVSSWAAPGSFPSSPIQAAAAWNRSMQLGRELQARTPNYRPVRYETLHSDGPQELERIFRWLELETDLASCQRAFDACRIDNLRAKTAAARGFFRKGSALGWREELSSSTLRLIEYICGDELERWGYERLHPRSKERPLRLALYEASARLLAKLRGKGKFLRGPGRAFQRLRRTIQLTGTFQKLG